MSESQMTGQTERRPRRRSGVQATESRRIHSPHTPDALECLTRIRKALAQVEHQLDWWFEEFGASCELSDFLDRNQEASIAIREASEQLRAIHGALFDEAAAVEVATSNLPSAVQHAECPA